MVYNLSNPLHLQQFKTRCESLANKACIVELTEKRSRSLSQNAYLHVILGGFALQYGESPEYCKTQFFKVLVNPHLFVVDKDDKFRGRIKVCRSSADLTTEEMTEAIERFRNWASKEVGVYLPAPHEHELLIQMAIETQRQNKYL